MSHTSILNRQDILDNLKDKLEKEAIDSVIVIRGGQVLWEYYKWPWSKGRCAKIFSVTKSFTGALIGQALAEGLIKNVEQPIADFFPTLQQANVDARKKAITIRHLLTHTSGLQWTLADVDELHSCADAVEYILSRSMEAAPGEKFVYNTGGSHLLSAIIQKVTGEDTLKYAEQHIFQPLGIEKYRWDKLPGGICDGGEGLRLRASDMAKFGYLYLNMGSWANRQIVPKEWILQSIKPQAGERTKNYGYQWWIYSMDGERYYLAAGYRGTRIYVLPKFEAVIVFAGRLKDQKESFPDRFILRLITRLLKD